MDKKYKVLLAISGCVLGISAFADDEPVLDLPSYYAAPAPKPPLSQRISQSTGWIHGFYINGNYGRSWLTAADLETQARTDGVNIPPLVDDKVSGSVNQFGLTLGYQFRPSGFFSRAELAYTHRSNFDYNTSNLFAYQNDATSITTTELNSTIKNQTLLAKVYYDFNFGSPFMPYVQIGAGMARNKVDGSSTSVFTFVPFPPASSSNSGTFSESTTGFAADAGFGTRIKFNEHVYLDASYEFDWLGGDLKWFAVTPTPGQAATEIDSGKFYSNNLIIGLTLKA